MDLSSVSRAIGENPGDIESQAAAKLLQKLANDLRRSPRSAIYTEYQAILNWLGEFDVMDGGCHRHVIEPAQLHEASRPAQSLCCRK